MQVLARSCCPPPGELVSSTFRNVSTKHLQRFRGVLRLIINADDFGLTLGVNRGIAEAWTRGIVNSVTIMANSRYFENAVGLVNSSSDKSLRPLSVGCHVVLTDGEPILKPQAIPTLIPPSSRPLFRKNFTEFAISAIAGRLAEDEIQAEAGAQISKLRQTGISVSHVDTHKHAHLFPKVLKPILRAAKAHGVRAVRNPFYPNRLPTMAEVAKRPRVARRYFQIPILRHFAGHFRRIVEAEGLSTTDGCLGVYDNSLLNCATLRHVI